MRKNQRVTDSLLAIGFIFYACFLAWIIMFKYTSPLEVFASERFFSRSINLIPFNDLINGYFNKMDLIGNIILFVPLGLYISMFFSSSKIYTNIYRVLLVSLMFEIAQYLLAIGATDITDIITNCIGGIIGIGIYSIIKLIFKTEINRKRFIAACSTLVVGVVGSILIGIIIYN